jgi:epoxyqueuosine reductase
MITKSELIEHALSIGFADIGFTTAEPFTAHKDFLLTKKDEYAWTETAGLALLTGTDPKTILPEAKSIIVLVEVYFSKSYPRSVENNFGRCYLDDDRVTKDGLAQKIKAFRKILRDNGIDSKVPFNLPHRLAAARAGVGTFGKNCLFYSRKAARKSSWVSPITIVVDNEFAPDESTAGFACPEWCRNACIAACPTRALKGNGIIDPRLCISYLTYYGDGLTPRELREPLGMFVYGCDRCQNVCPRNIPWISQELPPNEKVVLKSFNFDLIKLLHMDKEFFETRIWPHMFYMSFKDIWRWKMNVARVMGNSLDSKYVPELIRSFNENDDYRIQSMAAWALGKIGGEEAKTALKKFLINSKDTVREEIDFSLSSIN